MARMLFGTVAVPVSVVAGSGTPVGALNGFTLTLESMGTATYQLQISLDNSATPASTSWVNEGAALSAGGSQQVTKQCAWVRWNCTAFTSGAPTSRLAGVSVA